MKLSYYCSSCKKENQLETKANDRHELLMKLGSNEINERCKHCGNFTKKHLNRLFAETSTSIILIGLLGSTVLTGFLWMFIGLFSTISLSIPIGIWVDQNNKANRFNKTMIK